MPKIIQGRLYDVPSGLGGVFTVQALYVHENGDVDCRVYMPRNLDWHGWAVTARAEEMTLLNMPPPRAGWADRFARAA